MNEERDPVGAAPGGVGGMPTTTTSGVQARQDEKADGAAGTVKPAAPGVETVADIPRHVPSPPPSNDGSGSGTDTPTAEHGADRGSDDGLLESIGKAISSPVGAAAEDDEAEQTGDDRRSPGATPN